MLFTEPLFCLLMAVAWFPIAYGLGAFLVGFGLVVSSMWRSRS